MYGDASSYGPRALTPRARLYDVSSTLGSRSKTTRRMAFSLVGVMPLGCPAGETGNACRAEIVGTQWQSGAIPERDGQLIDEMQTCVARDKKCLHGATAYEKG
jgi:hypothetical protein